MKRVIRVVVAVCIAGSIRTPAGSSRPHDFECSVKILQSKSTDEVRDSHFDHLQPMLCRRNSCSLTIVWKWKHNPPVFPKPKLDTEASADARDVDLVQPAFDHSKSVFIILVGLLYRMCRRRGKSSGGVQPVPGLGNRRSRGRRSDKPKQTVQSRYRHQRTRRLRSRCSSFRKQVSAGRSRTQRELRAGTWSRMPRIAAVSLLVRRFGFL